jgi:hypothetical protein
VAANGISTLTYKRDRQEAKLALASANRAASGSRSSISLTQLPTSYAEGDNNTNNVINHANEGGLVVGRPWAVITQEANSFNVWQSFNNWGEYAGENNQEAYGFNVWQSFNNWEE